MSTHAPCDFVAAKASELGILGVAVGMWVDGREVHACQGVTSVENPLPVDPDTMYVLGSVTKAYTATALMRLVAEGRVELDAPVRRYVPELALASEEAAAQVTVLNLLTVSGVRPIRVAPVATSTTGAAELAAGPVNDPLAAHSGSLADASGMRVSTPERGALVLVATWLGVAVAAPVPGRSSGGSCGNRRFRRWRLDRTLEREIRRSPGAECRQGPEGSCVAPWARPG